MFWLARMGPGWLGAGLALLLGGLAVRINGSTMTGIDTSLLSWLRSHLSPAWQPDMSAIHDSIGEPMHFAVVAVLCATALSLHGRSATRGALLLAVTGTAAVTAQILKATIGRTAEPLMDFAHGFPSGHVTVWTSLLGMIAVILGTGHSRARKLALGMLAALGTLAVGVLALVSYAHVMTDVIGGIVLGATLVAFGAAALRVLPPTERLSQPAEVRPATAA